MPENAPSPVVTEAGPDEELAAMLRNLADRLAAVWREATVHVKVDGCPSHPGLVEWLERAEIDLYRFAHLTATHSEA